MERKVNYRFDTERAMELYERGLVDREIGEQVGVRGHVIAQWRKNEGLLANGVPGRNPSWCAEVTRLYEQGYIDREIAERVGVSSKTIGNWRKANRLPSNGVRGGKRKRSWCVEEARRAYDQGYNDHDVGKLVGTSGSAIGYWRRTNGLPTNDRRSIL